MRPPGQSPKFIDMFEVHNTHLDDFTEGDMSNLIRYFIEKPGICLFGSSIASLNMEDLQISKCWKLSTTFLHEAVATRNR